MQPINLIIAQTTNEREPIYQTTTHYIEIGEKIKNLLIKYDTNESPRTSSSLGKLIQNNSTKRGAKKNRFVQVSKLFLFGRVSMKIQVRFLICWSIVKMDWVIYEILKDRQSLRNIFHFRYIEITCYLQPFEAFVVMNSLMFILTHLHTHPAIELTPQGISHSPSGHILEKEKTKLIIQLTFPFH